jgi:hypothetical protein
MKHEAEVIHICVCCKADAGTRYHNDLADMVCQSCDTSLKWAQATLKTVGLRECQPVISNRVKGLFP